MKKKIILGLAMTMVSLLGNAADNLPALRVKGKNLVDATGKTVVLHGVMDTPNRYFNGWRWQQWKADYSEADIQQNSGIISIELANEPVRVHLSDGSNSDKALHDYFQSVVDVIRAQGFKGII
uniref:hypothetical protein n=1 Tax=Segatella hominis TaxID=2518605 RepID=UPI0040269475